MRTMPDIEPVEGLGGDKGCCVLLLSTRLPRAGRLDLSGVRAILASRSSCCGRNDLRFSDLEVAPVNELALLADATLLVAVADSGRRLAEYVADV
jgi:hypothetical protein